MKIDLRFTIDDLRLIAIVAITLNLGGCPDSNTSSKDNSSDATSESSILNRQSSIVNRPSPLHFTDITSSTGIDMTIVCGKAPADEILEVNGGGLGLIDFDNDGDLDLFVANGATLADPQRGPGCKLFENLGQFQFRDVTESSRIAVTRWANGVAIGDYDGDGFDDIFICCYGPNILLRNNGDKTFADVTATAFPSSQTPGANSQIPLWATSAAFGDIDNDGDLDLYVCNYLEFDHRRPPPRASYKNSQVMGGPHGLTPQNDLLFENRGDGTFADITRPAGALGPRPSFGLNVIIIDFDDDGWQDIVVANDSMPDFLFWNRSAGSSAPRFEEIGVISGIASNADGANQASMGYAIADVDGNGLPDKFTTVFSSDVNALHLNVTNLSAGAQSMPLFEDRSQQYGLAIISRPFLGWSCGFFDFDLDADEDLFFVNGHVYPQATRESMDSEYLQPPLLFERSGARFNRVKPENASGEAADWLTQPHRDRNAVFADFDHDGDIDIIIGELNGPIRVMRNDARVAASALPHPDTDRKSKVPDQKPTGGGWLIVELRDERPGTKNHRALGSKIALKAVSSGQGSVVGDQTRWLSTGGGFQSSGAPYVHFGLAQLPAHGPLTLEIRWPDGHTQRLDNVTPNQHLIVRRQD